MTFEVTAETVDEALAASEFGAKRVELCSGLDLGGLTPSPGLVRQCRSIPDVEIHVLIRPRPGNFIYDEDELQIMLTDIETLAAENIDGVVIGALDGNGNIDQQLITQLVERSKRLGLETTFHRAIDVCRDPETAIRELIDLGVDRILTSGQRPSAFEGIDMLEKMVTWANGNVQIMAGAGINTTNVRSIMETGVDAIHFSIRKLAASNPMGMGDNMTVDRMKIAALSQMLKGME